MDRRREARTFQLRGDACARSRRACNADQPRQSDGVSRQAIGACAGVLATVGIWTLPPRDHRGVPAAHSPDEARAQLRDDALRRARTRLGGANRAALVTPPPDPAGALARDPVECQFIPHVPGGTSFKFDCALPGGEVIAVKYGHEPEIPAEVAATRLLAALGYASDHVYLLPRLRCHGCPENPYVTMVVLDVFGASAIRARGSADFEWVAVERKFEAPPIDDKGRKGWAWWELKQVGAPREDVDALRLLATFLAHW